MTSGDDNNAYQHIKVAYDHIKQGVNNPLFTTFNNEITVKMTPTTNVIEVNHKPVVQPPYVKYKNTIPTIAQLKNNNDNNKYTT